METVMMAYKVSACYMMVVGVVCCWIFWHDKPWAKKVARKLVPIAYLGPLPLIVGVLWYITNHGGWMRP